VKKLLEIASSFGGLLCPIPLGNVATFSVSFSSVILNVYFINDY